MNRPTIAFAVALPLLTLSPQAGAQHVWTTDPGGPAVFSFASPEGPCLFPSDDGASLFPTASISPVSCAGAITLPPLDVAIDRFTDTVWLTYGPLLAHYERDGTWLGGSTPPPGMGPINGIGFGMLFGVLPVLVVTDGAVIGVIAPPVDGLCAAPTALVVPAVPVLIPAIASDVDFDPFTGTLFVSYFAGFVSNELVGGGAGPAGAFFPAAPCLGLPLGPISGIAVDVTVPGTLFVRGPDLLERILVGGALAPPGPGWSLDPCVTLPPGTGLGFDVVPAIFGTGCNPLGLPPLSIGALAQATSPSPAFEILLGGGVPGAPSLLVLSLATACPTPLLLGCPIYALPIVTSIPMLTLGGPAALPAPLPPGLPAGLAFRLQWISAAPGGIETSPGLRVVIGEL